jgi:HSP20 family protein
MEELRRRAQRMLDDLGEANGTAGDWTLAVDLIERYVLPANVPGIKPDDVKIEVEDDVLTVSAAHEESTEKQKKNYVRRDRRYGSFSRSIALPRGVSADDIEAGCRDGVVEVSIPKPKKATKPVTITPKTA